MLRILHAPINVAGQAGVISRGQRLLGFQSDILVFKQNYLNYECDINLNLDKKPFLLKVVSVWINFIHCLFSYDVFHFHFGISLLPYNLDLPLYRLLAKKVVMQYWGSDVLQTDLARKYTLFDDETFRKVYPKVNNEKKRRKLAWIARHVNQTIVGDYSLSCYTPEAIVIRQAINLENLPFIGAKENSKKIKIVHAPSNRDIKGTKYILEAIKRLKKEKYPIDFIMVERRTHKEAIEIYQKTDIVVDDVLQGPYGILAMEAMSLGKPVLCRIDPTFTKYYKNLPIVNTSPNQIYANLKRLIEHPLLRKRLGEEGRKYIEKNHDFRKIAKQLIKIYEKL